MFSIAFGFDLSPPGVEGSRVFFGLVRWCPFHLQKCEFVCVSWKMTCRFGYQMVCRFGGQSSDRGYSFPHLGCSVWCMYGTVANLRGKSAQNCTEAMIETWDPPLSRVHPFTSTLDLPIRPTSCAACPPQEQPLTCPFRQADAMPPISLAEQ